MYKFPRYTKNLSCDDSFIYTYNTKVAEIDHVNETIKLLGYWSKTTSTHINYVARQLGYTLCKE